MSRVLIVAGLVCALTSWARGALDNPEAPPNVLLICIDDLNDWVEPLRGHPQVKTPHLSRLAARGTNFTNAHCQSPLCNPSRTSFLTGLRPSTTGVYALNPWFRTAPAWKDVVTLPQFFMARNYEVMTCGKVFHDAYPPKDQRDNGQEFTVWGYHGNAGPLPDTKFVPTPDDIKLMDWGIYPERDELQEDWKIADWAIARLKEDRSRPFFLSVGFRRPHVPCYASAKWFDLYPEPSLILPPIKLDDRDDTPRFSWYLHWKLPEPRLDWLERSQQLRPLVRAYLASISFVDSQVGRVLDALDEAGLADRTIVALLSDHGWHLGEKGISGKNTLWDRSTRVPLIIAAPGMPRGSTCHRPAELLDLYPTLIDLCFGVTKADLEGHSLVPQLKDSQAPRPWPAITSHGPNNHGIRDERWRYIRYADGSEELYDMRADPNEWTNLAADPRLVSTKADLSRWLPRVNAAPVAGSVARLIEIKDGVPLWQGQPIRANDPIPEK
jgi:arylsulfatase A-like enzyme